MARPDKKTLRRACLARRDAIAVDDARRWSTQACAHAVGLIERLGVRGPVGGYWPIGSELDCRPALAALAGRGHVIGLPAVVAAHQPLVFRCWREGDALSSGAHDTFEPLPSQTACLPALLLVPLLGFDAAGHRLGYGGGYYDRSIQALRAGGGRWSSSALVLRRSAWRRPCRKIMTRGWTGSSPKPAVDKC